MRSTCSTLISSYPQRHWYQGDYSELDPETGLQAFDLRMYSSRIGRWLSYAQYWSPYVAMEDRALKISPVERFSEGPACRVVVSEVDPDGGASKDTDPNKKVKCPNHNKPKKFNTKFGNGSSNKGKGSNITEMAKGATKQASAAIMFTFQTTMKTLGKLQDAAIKNLNDLGDRLASTKGNYKINDPWSRGHDGMNSGYTNWDSESQDMKNARAAVGIVAGGIGFGATAAYGSVTAVDVLFGVYGIADEIDGATEFSKQIDDKNWKVKVSDVKDYMKWTNMGRGGYTIFLTPSDVRIKVATGAELLIGLK
jgi:hypothetical protein